MLQITFEVVRRELRRAETLLIELGAQSVTFRDAADSPVLEPGPGEIPLWPTIRVCGLYPADTDTMHLQRVLNSHFEAARGVTIETLPDKDWSRACLHDFQPARFGSRLWICPSWCTPPQPQAVNILLDPGLAFGTGTHPTTSLCLEWLDNNPPAALTVLDYGCGSGVLGIAAARLGAQRVIAVDNDPQALTATRANAANNRLDDQAFETLGIEAALPPVDLLMANILSQPLISLVEHLTGLLRPRARLVLSGILADQAERVRAAYNNYCRMEQPVEKEGWVLLEGRAL